MTDPDSSPNSAPDRILCSTAREGRTAFTDGAFLHFFVFSPGDR